MADENLPNNDRLLTSIKLSFQGIPDHLLYQVTPNEIILGESLLTPGLQTSVQLYSYFQNLPIKNLDLFKNAQMNIELERPILKDFGIQSTMNISQVTYRLDRRKLYNNNVEDFVLHACDQTLLNDAAVLVSKLWKCKTPSTVTQDVLSTCAGAKNLDIEESQPARDYIAENIHPFQVVAQQAQAALAGGDDPSFLHYMTYDNFGTHHFRSLKYLTSQPPVMEFLFSEIPGAAGYANPYAIITHSFPCDFDLLSDILNGVDSNGKDINTLMVFNPLLKMFNQFGSQVSGCGLGSGVVKLALSNMASAKQQNACPDYTHIYLQKRQARMALLEKDKIALRITVPWNPILHAGKIIKLTLPNKNDPTLLNYGSGEYLIVSMVHNIKYGGYSTTTMDCVSKTVGQGIV